MIDWSHQFCSTCYLATFSPPRSQQTIDEYTTRVGQQAVVMFVTPGKPNNSYKVFGAKPLEDVVSNERDQPV